MDWASAKELATILTPLALAMMAYFTVRQNAQLAAAKLASDTAAAAATHAAEEAAAAVRAARTHTTQLVEVRNQLDGRLTNLIRKFEDELQAEKQKNADIYEAGLAAGRAKALEGPIAEKIAKVEEHLDKQDKATAERAADQ